MCPHDHGIQSACISTLLRDVFEIHNEHHRSAENLAVADLLLLRQGPKSVLRAHIRGAGLLLVTAGASYTGVDNLLGLLIFHLCGQMENLKGRLINMKQFKSFNSNLTLIVRDHIRLIKFRIGFNIALGSLRDYQFDVRLFRNTICVLVPIHRCALRLIRTTGVPFSDILILSKTRLLYYYSDCCFILVPSFVCMDF